MCYSRIIKQEEVVEGRCANSKPIQNVENGGKTLGINNLSLTVLDDPRCAVFNVKIHKSVFAR